MILSTDEGYKRRVRQALDAIGCDAPETDAIKLVAWSIKQGRNLPWWVAHERMILEDEGGYLSVHQSVMALTIGLMSQGTFALADAAQEAGDQYRKALRKQWDYPIPDLFAVSLDADDVNEALFVDNYEPPPEPFSEHNMTDPRLIEAWEQATPKQRELLRLVADGVNVTQAAAHLGVNPVTAWQRLDRVRKRASKAMGAA